MTTRHGHFFLLAVLARWTRLRQETPTKNESTFDSNRDNESRLQTSPSISGHSFILCERRRKLQDVLPGGKGLMGGPNGLVGKVSAIYKAQHRNPFLLHINLQSQGIVA